MASALANTEELFTFYWSVKNLRFCTLQTGEFLKSPSFHLPNFQNTTWHLNLYPEGKDADSAGYVSLFLKREQDKGPETIEIISSFSTHLYATEDYSTETYSKDDGKGYIEFLSPDVKPTYQYSLDIKCKMQFSDSTVADTLSFVENPSCIIKPEIQHITMANKRLKLEAVAQVDRMKKEMFAWPLQTFACSRISVTNKSIEWPVDESIIDEGDFNQIVPVLSTENLLSITMKKSDDFINAEVILENQNSKKVLLVVCKLNLLIEEKKSVKLFEEKYKLNNKEKNVLNFYRTIKLSDLKLNKSMLRCTKWKFEFAFSNGDVISEIIHEEYGKSVFECSSDDTSKVNDQMELFYNENKLCDIVIQVKNKTFQAHKFVLSVMSPVFSAMFSNDMEENKKNVLEIVDFDEEVISNMLSFIYKGAIKNLEFSDACKLFPAADKYAVLPLMNVYRNVLVENIMYDNVCEVLSLAAMHNDIGLETACIKFICFFKNHVLNSDEWTNFEKENTNAAVSVLRKICLLT